MSQKNTENIKINNFINNSSNSEININKFNDMSSLHFSRLNVRQIFNPEEKIKKNDSDIKKAKKQTYYVKKKLFPYKYYLCSIFIKNIDISKESIFFTKKFVAVYNFICQLFDVSSYLILQREFQILKNTLIIGKYKDIVESKRKINVNDRSFNNDMKECLDFNKFSILGKLKNNKEISQ